MQRVTIPNLALSAINLEPLPLQTPIYNYPYGRRNDLRRRRRRRRERGGPGGCVPGRATETDVTRAQASREGAFPHAAAPPCAAGSGPADPRRTFFLRRRRVWLWERNKGRRARVQIPQPWPRARLPSSARRWVPCAAAAAAACAYTHQERSARHVLPNRGGLNHTT